MHFRVSRSSSENREVEGKEWRRKLGRRGEWRMEGGEELIEKFGWVVCLFVC